MRMIDADEEIKWANDNLPDAHAGVITAFLRDCATIDAVPVVRCKDCKHVFERSGRKPFGCYLHGKKTELRCMTAMIFVVVENERTINKEWL